MLRLYRHPPLIVWTLLLALAVGGATWAMLRPAEARPAYRQENARAALDEARGLALTASVAGDPTVKAAASHAAAYARSTASWVSDRQARRQLNVVADAAERLVASPTDANRAKLRDLADRLHWVGPEHFPRIPGVAPAAPDH